MKNFNLIVGLMMFFIALGTRAEQPAVNGWRLNAETSNSFRLVLDVSEQVGYEVKRQHNPERVTVSLFGADFKAKTPVIPDDVSFVESVSVVGYQEVFRFVLNLKDTGQVTIEDRWLQPDDGFDYRLVVDLTTREVANPAHKAFYARSDAGTTESVPRFAAVVTPPAKVPNIGTLPVTYDGAVPAPAVIIPNPNMRPIVAPTCPVPVTADNHKGKRERSSRAKPRPYVRDYRLDAAPSYVRLNTQFPTNTRGRKLVVVIDPGHGGDDTGAIGLGGTREKDVVLAIAKRLARQINASPGMSAILTRDSDFFIPLRQRVVKARQANADLFVSVHADAAYNRGATGASVYTLSEKGASSAAARALADRENAYDSGRQSSDFVGGSVAIGDNGKELDQVMVELSLSATMDASRQAAYDVLRYMSGIGSIHKDEVQHAGFAVLKAHDVPGMLVETAYISNAEEEILLGDPKYQEQIAAAIFSGINEHFHACPPAGSMIAQVVRTQNGAATSQ